MANKIEQSWESEIQFERNSLTGRSRIQISNSNAEHSQKQDPCLESMVGQRRSTRQILAVSPSQGTLPFRTAFGTVSDRERRAPVPRISAKSFPQTIHEVMY